MNGVLPKVSPQVVAALEKADEVLIVVVLQSRGGEHNDTVREFRRARTEHNRVLARLSANEFNVTIVDLPELCYAWVTKSGLAKLAGHTDVREVSLPAPLGRVGGEGRRAP